jgi:hypothetical protein
LFGELPKLFDRDFVIAFFLPATILVAASLGMGSAFGLLPRLLSISRTDILQAATILGVASWLGGVLLLVLNYNLFRLFEGYGNYNPLRYFERFEKNKYERMQESIGKLREEIKEKSSDAEEEVMLIKLRAQRDRLLAAQVENYPSDPKRILPTAFGNAIRGFEDYPTDMYGVDSIMVWVRLLAVIPKDYRELIDAAKAQTDFWLNLWFLGFLILIEYIFLVIYSSQLKMIWCPLAAIGFAWMSAKAARGAAISWGDYIKASFDLFLPDLRAKLQLPFPKDITEERKLWTRFSQVVIYHQPSKVASRVEPQVGGNQGPVSSQDVRTR